MSHFLSRFPRAVLAAAAVLLLAGTALAQYPRKTVTIITPYAPGGSSDLAARSLAASAPKYLGRTLVVVNRDGAGGVLGSTVVSHSRPDGYTLLLGRVGSNCLAPALNSSLNYAWDDFTFLGMVEMNPFVYVVRADSPYKTLEDLLEAVREHPGTISYSNSGPQSLLTVGTLMLLDQAGLPPDAAIGLPYKGGGKATTALIGGHVDFLGVNIGPVIEQIKGGKLRALAVTTEERLPDLPDVPTARECGFPGLESVVGWSVLLGPKGLPEDVVAQWKRVMPEIAKDPEWLSRAKTMGAIPFIRSPEETREFVRKQYEMYRNLGKKRGLIVQ